MMQSVSVPAMLCAGLSGAVAVLVPVVLAVLCCRRRRGAWRAVLVGALCFFAGAMVLESLCHQLVLSLFPALRQTPLLYIVYGCLAAGVFEETARLIGLRLLCRRDGSAVTGFAYGVGHGGIESILVAGLGAVSNLATMAAINAGQAGEILAAVPEAQQAAVQAQLEQLAQLPAAAFLAGGVERCITMALHIALSMLVWMTVTGRLPKWGYPAAILLHALTDVTAVVYQLGYITSIWLTEAIIAAVTLAICLGVRRLYKTHPGSAA